MSTNNLIIEQVSPFDVPTTIEKLLSAANQKEWQNPAVHNLQQSLAKSGKEVRPVQVIEICKPEFSGKMLEKNHERIVSIMMPCRISVYEKEDGKAYVALMNTAAMKEGMPSSVAEVMQIASDETFEIVQSVIGAF
ncbi:MAG: DUF302 domain-containing protein [Bacteroidales bacterium]|jgi:uncharacterized protein (DUF302 family)|nr:DUF302 domain-containing protein [Bacteroidales bacterium]